MPLYPLNPAAQDTVAAMTLHLAVGMSGPSNVLSIAPEFSTRWEFLISHPFVIRAGIDYRFPSVNSNQYPNGRVHAGTISSELLYYRGTRKVTGYLGAGVVYMLNNFSPDDRTADSLRTTEAITDVSMRDSFGYRLSFGLRFKRTLSVEVGITQLSPGFVFVRRSSPNSFQVSRETVRLNDFRVSIGYLISLKRI